VIPRRNIEMIILRFDIHLDVEWSVVLDVDSTSIGKMNWTREILPPEVGWISQGRGDNSRNWEH
jgi:hypothetical protein